MGRIVTVDLEKKRVTSEKADNRYLFQGGRGLTSQIVYEEVNPAIDPLSPDNMLVIAPGMLAGNIISSCNRLSAGSKSPLTHGIKEANSGGTAAFHLARAGIQALKITKSADKESLLGLYIDSESMTVVDLKFLEGKGTYETTAILQEKYGKKCAIMSIGPAGEKLYTTASICVTDMQGEPCRVLARGGLGAVMGSKRLKAIIIVPSNGSSSGNSPEITEIAKKFAKKLKENPVTGDLFPKFGTAMTMNNVNLLGGLPTRNFSRGYYEKSVHINGDALRKTLLDRGGDTTHSCMPGCVIRCSNKYVKKDGSPLVGALDYETLCLMGSNLEIADLDTIATLNYLCNDIGVDTIEIGAALGVLSEGGILEFGNDDQYIEAVESLRCQSGNTFADLLGDGAVACGNRYGVKRVPAVKGQSMAAYDPRVIKGMGITYALSPMGADHTAGNAITLPIDHNDVNSLVSPVRDLHIKYYILDTLGMCIFTGRVSLAEPEILAEMVSAVVGVKVSFQDLYRQAIQNLMREVDFNRKAGLGEEDDQIPEFMLKEPLLPNNTVFNVPKDEMDTFYKNIHEGVKL